jgi:hypothetical protein
MGQDRELLALVADAAAQVAPGNPWAGGGKQAFQPAAMPDAKGFVFSRPEMETWFWEMYYPAMSPEDRMKIDALNTAEIATSVLFKAPRVGVASTAFNFENKSLEINISPEYENFRTPEGGIDYKQIVPLLGDELQHAYQFLKGEIGFLNIRRPGETYSPGASYDLEDEVDSLEGALRAVENYVMFHFMETEQERLDFLNTKAGRIAGFDKIKDDGTNYGLNRAIGYFALVKNTTKPPSDLISARKYVLGKGGYNRDNFALGTSNEGEKTNSKDIQQRFPIGSRIASDQVVVGQAFYLGGKLNVLPKP